MFTLKFKTGNAAFMDDNGEENNGAENYECARILRDISIRLGCGFREGLVMDINGNHIGKWELK